MNAEDELSDTDRRERLPKLEQVAPILERHAIEVMSTPEEHEVWRLAELVAKTLDVPMVDWSDKRPVERTPAELDRSLAERLAVENVEDPWPAPSNVFVEEVDVRLQIEWSARFGGRHRLELSEETLTLTTGGWRRAANTIIPPRA